MVGTPTVTLDKTEVVFPKTRSVTATLTLPAPASERKLSVLIGRGLLSPPDVTAEPAGTLTTRVAIEDNFGSCPIGGPGFVAYDVDQQPGQAVTLQARFRADVSPAPLNAMSVVAFTIVQAATASENVAGTYNSRPIAFRGRAAQQLTLHGGRSYKGHDLTDRCIQGRQVKPGQPLSVSAHVLPARSGVVVRLVQVGRYDSASRRVVGTARTDRFGRCVFHPRASSGSFGLEGHVNGDAALVAVDSENELFYQTTPQRVPAGRRPSL